MLSLTPHHHSLVLYLAKRYTKEHEWISVEDDVGTIGITDYAQKSLGDVVFVEIPSPGQAISRKGELHPARRVNEFLCLYWQLGFLLEQIGAVESVKAASDIYSPVSGDIIEANETLDQEPGLINSSPEQDGKWSEWSLGFHLKDLMYSVNECLLCAQAGSLRSSLVTHLKSSHCWDEKAYQAHWEESDDH